MKKYVVSLHLTTTEASLSDLSNLLKIDNSADSHDFGSLRPSLPGTPGRIWKKTIWKYEVPPFSSQNLRDNIRSLFQTFPMERLRSPVLPKDTKKMVDVAIYYDTASCTIDLDNESLSELGAYGINLEISCYLCTPDDDTASDSVP